MRVVDVVQVIVTVVFYEIFRKLYLDFKLSLQIRNGTAYRVKDEKSSLVIRGTKEFIDEMKEKYPEEFP